MIKYFLEENNMAGGKHGPYFAKAVEVVKRDRKYLIKKIHQAKPGINTNEPAEILGAILRCFEDIVANGECFVDEVLEIRPGIQGTFTGLDDAFDPARHEVGVALTPGRSLLKAASKITLEKVILEEPKPTIEKVYDRGTNTSNGGLTPGEYLEIIGERLKIQGAHVGEGVWFINHNDGHETKAGTIRRNFPNQLTVQVPILPKGSYRIEVRNTLHDNLEGLKVAAFGHRFAIR